MDHLVRRKRIRRIYGIWRVTRMVVLPFMLRKVVHVHRIRGANWDGID